MPLIYPDRIEKFFAVSDDNFRIWQANRYSGQTSQEQLVFLAFRHGA
jgi:hypothetical protein